MLGPGGPDKTKCTIEKTRHVFCPGELRIVECRWNQNLPPWRLQGSDFEAAEGLPCGIEYTIALRMIV